MIIVNCRGIVICYAGCALLTENLYIVVLTSKVGHENLVISS